MVNRVALVSGAGQQYGHAPRIADWLRRFQQMQGKA